MSKKRLTLEEFAALAGVTFIECGPEWGGRIGYQMADCPNMSMCGFRSEKAALNSWLKGKFGENTAKALKLLLAPSKAAGSTP